MAAPVLLFWIDPGGDKRDYGSVAAGGRRTMHTFAGHVWMVTDPEKHTLGVFEATEDPASAVIPPGAGKLEAAPPDPSVRTDSAASAGERRSPNNEFAAFYRENNVWIRRLSTGEEFALSHDGKEGDRYEDSLSWSPDSRRLVFLRTVPGDDHRVSLVESSPPDQVQPRLHSIHYLKPGDKIPLTRPQLFDVLTRQEIPIDDTLFPNPWSIEDLRWQPDSKRITFYYNQRGHQVLRIIAVDARTGRTTSIIEETSPTFIDYAGKHFCQYLDDTGEILWMSERDGWNHLYLYDAASGAVKNQITRGSWVVRSVDRVDTAARQVWFRAGGIYPDQDPYHVHFCRAGFDGTGLVTLTEGDGTHSISYSPDNRFFIDTWSRVDLPPETELRRSADGKLVCK
ncbi:MAG: DPP IV N-terminal domain-containing protein, partial [Chloroflexi bacterium]|nr:DPP IV N-terminal domain-containing protein [Chloroflexota bacterium]